MSRRYPPLDRAQVERVLLRAGFGLKRKRASHAQWEGRVKGRRRIVTVDHLSGKKEKYGNKLLSSMIRQSGLTRKEFYSYL